MQSNSSSNEEDSSCSSDSDSDSDDSDDSDNLESSELNPSREFCRHVSSIHEAKLFPDGLGFITADYDRTLSVYAIPADAPNALEVIPLEPYAQIKRAEPIWSFAIHPRFSVADPTTSHVLVGCRDSYVTLYNALWDVTRNPFDENGQPVPPPPGPPNISAKLASYKIIDPMRETVLAPNSLTYNHDGTRFIAGLKDAVTIFDMDYTESPVLTQKTIPSRNSKLKGGGRGFKGVISALSLAPQASGSGGILAAGSRTRWVALYESAGDGNKITEFSLPTTLRTRCNSQFGSSGSDIDDTPGSGISQLKWSACGTYLYVAERVSDSILIYDRRNFGFALSHCAGRNARTNNRLGFDVWSASTHYHQPGTSEEVWAGGIDGKIRIWRDPYFKEGALEADEVVQVGEDPITSTLVHPYGSLAVVCSGRYEYGLDVPTSEKGLLMDRRGCPKLRQWGSVDILGLT
ncbi:WD40 repeat-like protein [Corynespora cassiicola Philippines]|uniref:WD40 repeat-like protein n=1 Tax=Corynespora cassiicola Philippines TaxID=1448308 RepID=A0A2T2P6D9_CORCC|nr:WD40 repeat-like protein [Corynespora cassiicola Philippines]